ncbi:tumor necrosis factor receptor superfamily member 4 isoform X2 [Prinia subflava]
MALPRIPWNFPFPVLCLLLAVPVPASRGLECREHQHRFHGRCCSDCAPGERMRSRCTAWADTVCSPCQVGYFSARHHHGFCRSCTVCQARKGSVEVKPCERTSDRVCVCQAGFQPSGTPAGSECSRCPEGTFSKGRNENCQPWTNCSSSGRSTLRAGSATEDALCSSPGLEFPGNRDPLPTEFPGNRDPLPTEFPENGSRASSPSDVPAVCRDPGSAAEPSWGKESWEGISSWSCFPGKGIPTFLAFTQSRIPHFQLELLSWEGNSHFSGFCTFQNLTFPAGQGIRLELLSWEGNSRFSGFHTVQDPTFPAGAAFLGREFSLFWISHIPRSHISSWAGISSWSCVPGKGIPAFLDFTHSKIPHFQLGRGSGWSCFPGKGIPNFSEALPGFYTTFQDPTFPAGAAFLGREFPLLWLSHIPRSHISSWAGISSWSCFPGKGIPAFQDFTHSRIPHFQLELLSWEGNSRFSGFHTFQDPTFPAGQGFPAGAAFLGREFPFSQKPDLDFTKPPRISSFPGKSNPIFSKAIPVFPTAFQNPTFPWHGFSLCNLGRSGDSKQNQESWGNFWEFSLFREFFRSNSRFFIPAPAVPDPAAGEWNFHPAPDPPGSPEKNQEWLWEEHPAQ